MISISTARRRANTASSIRIVFSANGVSYPGPFSTAYPPRTGMNCTARKPGVPVTAARTINPANGFTSPSILKSVPALLRFFMPSLPCDHSKGSSKGTHGQLVEKLIFLFDHLSNSIYHQGIAHQLQPLKHDVSYDIFSAFGTNFHQAFIILITNKTIDKKSSHNPYTQDYAQFFV